MDNMVHSMKTSAVCFERKMETLKQQEGETGVKRKELDMQVYEDTEAGQFIHMAVTAQNLPMDQAGNDYLVKFNEKTTSWVSNSFDKVRGIL